MTHKNAQSISMENGAIDPTTSHMLSERSTIGGNAPSKRAGGAKEAREWRDENNLTMSECDTLWPLIMIKMYMRKNPLDKNVRTNKLLNFSQNDIELFLDWFTTKCLRSNRLQFKF